MPLTGCRSFTAWGKPCSGPTIHRAQAGISARAPAPAIRRGLERHDGVDLGIEPLDMIEIGVMTSTHEALRSRMAP